MSKPSKELLLPAGAELLISSAQINAGFDSLARELQGLVDSRDCVLMGVMNGGLYPLMQLITRLTGNYRIGYCHATRYRGSTRGHAINWVREPEDIAGKTVLLVDDIYDEGITLETVADKCRANGADIVHTVVEVVKQQPRRASHLAPDFSTGLIVPDRYVFGCGMDLAGRWRHLPDIYSAAEGVA